MSKTINLKLSTDILAALIRLISAIEKMFQEGPPFPPKVPDDDPELAADWLEGLQSSLLEDCQFLVNLLNETKNSSHPTQIALDEEGMETALRVASAIRIKLRSVFFNEYSDAELKELEIDASWLSPEEQKPYTCYVFLSDLQKTLIQALEPDLLSS